MHTYSTCIMKIKPVSVPWRVNTPHKKNLSMKKRFKTKAEQKLKSPVLVVQVKKAFKEEEIVL